MTQTKTKTKTRKRRRISVAGVILVLGIAILLVPVIIFGYLLYDATLGTGTPLFGSRFTNDLDPKITSEQLTTVETALDGLTNVESATINLKSATVRITVDTADTLIDAAGVQALSTQVYDSIIATLPIETYFTSDEVKKMYDLEISVYNLKDGKDQANYFYFILVKNANMETWKIQEVSKPLNPELAQELLDKLNAEETENQEG